MKPTPQHIFSNPDGKELIHVYERRASTGAKIFLIVPVADIGPEHLSMIQALYSRDPNSILNHLEEVVKKGAERFMKQYYVQYGHKSIGDCGHVLLAYEGVSIIAVKAIQDTQLYAGQEASTRYLDFSGQPFFAMPDDLDMENITLIHSSLDTPTGRIQERQRQMYLKLLPLVQADLEVKYPWADQVWKKPEEEEKNRITYNKAIKARSFDIVRSLLPAGATTMTSWYTSISHAADHFMWLRCHALAEVRELGLLTEELLKEVYPSSFEGRKLYEERENYKKDFYNESYYLRALSDAAQAPEGLFYADGMNSRILADDYKKWIMSRPQGVELPYQIGEAGTFSYTALLDYGSFRDLQRHRAIVQRQGLLTSAFGFHPWYMENFPADMQDEVQQYLTDLLAEVDALPLDPVEKQYFYPMGMMIPTRTIGHLGKMTYLIELRCQTVVHPTAHQYAYNLSQKVQAYLSEALEVKEVPLYIDANVGAFSLKRGTQDIVKQVID